jgi:polysaccharide export outer membrane protein
MRALSLVSIAFAALLAGCAYGPSGGRVGETGLVQVVNTDDLPQPTVADTTRRSRPYVIGAGDVLTIDVVGIEHMNDREITVDGAGRISIPLAGTIDAAGNTPEELTALIVAKMRESYVRNPIVSVNVKEAVSQFVTVDGQVIQPGNYPILADMTLTRSIASARGVGDFAKTDDVVVLRSVNGQRYAGVYNLAAIRRGNYPDPQIYANVVVVVGDSTALRRMKDLITILPAITSPLIYLLDNN